MRLGILPINIETGRYKSVPLVRRLYTLCNLNQIQNEIHILFIAIQLGKKRLVK